MGLVVYKNGKETVCKMQTLFFLSVLKTTKKTIQNQDANAVAEVKFVSTTR